MQEQTILFPVPISELKNLISQSLQEIFTNNQTAQKLAQEMPQYLTRKETAIILGVSLVTLHSYTKQGKIKVYRIGGRLRYKKQDIENSLKEVPNYLKG